MSEKELININGIREDLYQAMQIGDITLNSKHSQELYDFMNYQDKEIERLNKSLEEQRHFYLEKIQQKENIIKEVREYIENVETLATILFRLKAIDNVNILSISKLKSILDKGEE